MAKTLSNDVIVLQHRIAMRERAQIAARFIITRKRRWSVDELARVIYTAWEGKTEEPSENS